MGAPVQGFGVFPHGMLRAAAWPIETADRFAAPDLGAMASAVMVAEAAVVARRGSTLVALEGAVPRTAEPGNRGWLLRMKRQVYGGDTQLETVPVHVEEAIAASTPEVCGPLGEERLERGRLAERRAALERAWQDEMSRQSDVLRRLTAEPRFLRALSVTNPAIAERWERRIHGRSDGRGAGNGREVRLEATVFRFLMRAAGRATPQGAWAGVAPVEIGPPPDCPDGGAAPPLAVAPCAGRYLATPDLGPFAAVVDALARLPRYWVDSPVRLDPTAHQVGTTWWYERSAGTTGRQWVEVPADPVLAVIIEAYSDGEARRARPLLDALAALVPERDRLREDLAGALERLVALDVLRSDLVLPTAPRGAWEALDAVADRLVEPDRSLWVEVVSRIREHCDRLGGDFDALQPGEIRAVQAAVTADVDRLLVGVGLEPSPPDTGPLLHVDLRLPFVVVWSPAMMQRVGAAAEEVMAFHTTVGDAERFRVASLRPIVAAVPPCTEVPLLWLLRTVGPQLALAHDAPAPGTRRATAWDDLLDRSQSLPSCTLPRVAVGSRARPGPSGALLLSVAVHQGPGPTAPPAAGPRAAPPTGEPGSVELRVEWGRPQPALFVSRWAQLLGGEAGAGSGLVDALARDLEGWASSGVGAVEIVGDDPANRNAAVRPPVPPLRLEPHSGAGLRPSDLTVRLEHDRPWLSRRGREERLVPVYGSAAAIGLDDPCSRLLLRLAMSHGWELLSLGSPLLTERGDRPHLPRVVLPGGTVVSGERWSLDRDAVAALAVLAGWEQYLAWRRHADRLGLPSRVWAGAADRPDPERLLLLTDSPLSVRCLLKELSRRPQALVMVEGHGDPTTWPVGDGQGNHYHAELAVSWYDDTHWQALAAATPEWRR